MDYYEELGVEWSASPEEIRRQYRQLVRLLHPDHCRDEQLRVLAELQMKRLNGILEVLTDPESRESYNREAAGAVIPCLPAPPEAPAIWWRQCWQWLAAGAVFLVLLTAVFAYRPKEPVAPIAAPDSPDSPVVPPPSKGPIRSARPPARARPALESLPRPTPAVEPGESPPPIPVFRAPPVEMPAVLASQPQAVAHEPPTDGLAGVWLLASAASKREGLYRPEYIELRLTEDGGVLRGRYRARYSIPDRAISPLVSFQFEGPASEDRANLPWSGTGGARGEVELRLVTSGTLEVNWVATRLSDELGLISGAATLVRRAD